MFWHLDLQSVCLSIASNLHSPFCLLPSPFSSLHSPFSHLDLFREADSRKNQLHRGAVFCLDLLLLFPYERRLDTTINPITTISTLTTAIIPQYDNTAVSQYRNPQNQQYHGTLPSSVGRLTRLGRKYTNRTVRGSTCPKRYLTSFSYSYFVFPKDYLLAIILFRFF